MSSRPRYRALKREKTVIDGLPAPTQSMNMTGLPTPDQSMTSSTGIPTPKQEDADDEVEVVFSNKLEDRSRRAKTDPEIVGNRLAKGEESRQIRSPSPSLVSISGSSSRHCTASVAPLARRPSVARHSMAPSSAIASIPGASLELIGEKVNMLVNAIEALRKLGLKELDTELPELVLVGDQSSGKSTLMSAIAEINLPKDSGMCTRCPSNIKTSPSDTWSCTVSLRLDYTYTTDKRRAPTKSNQFPPWVENSVFTTDSIKTFKTISKKSELEEVLRWAQVALLNPNQDYRAFIPGTGSTAQSETKPTLEADYSPNIVQIEISGPRLPALSFYDLPGNFMTSATTEEEYLITAFDNITAKYVCHKNALVICALAMTNDPGNAKTSNLIRKNHAQNRTIGVLTKPDLLQDGSVHLEYDKILRGTAHVFPRGYFITKQPGPGFALPPNGDYHSQAREEEQKYFNTNKRWTEEWAEFRERCGTVALQTYLSQEFARLIANSMPNIDQKIKAQSAEVDNELNHLPELPADNVQHVVRQCLHNFSNGVQNLIEGGSRSSNRFMSSWSVIGTDFSDTIQEIKPKFIIHDDSDVKLPEVDVIVLDDSDNESRVSWSASTVRGRGLNDIFTPPSKRLKVDDSSVPFPRLPNSQPRPKVEAGSDVDSQASSNRPVATPRSKGLRRTVFDDYLHRGKSFMSLVEIRATIYNHRTPGHPDNVPDSAREELCLLSIGSWFDVLEKLAKITFRMLYSAIMKTMESTMGNYQQTELFRRSESLVKQFLTAQQKTQLDALHTIFKLEAYKLFTVHNHAFSMYKAEELQILQAARRNRRIKCLAEQRAKQGKILTAKEQNSITDEQLGADPFALEVETAAWVRGYYRVAGHRFADNVLQNIIGTLFLQVKDKISGLLEGELGLNSGDGEAKCRLLMEEDDSKARERSRLQEKKAKLTHAADRLGQLVQELGIEPEAAAEMDADEDYDFASLRDTSIDRRARVSAAPRED